MATNWRSWCRGAADLTLLGKGVTVALHDGRSQRVRLWEDGQSLEMESVVVGASHLRSIDAPEDRVWTRNRSARRVGFRFDTRGRLVATAWVPLAGLEKQEFLTALRHLAEEADLLEFQLTGGDRE